MVQPVDKRVLEGSISKWREGGNAYVSVEVSSRLASKAKVEVKIRNFSVTMDTSSALGGDDNAPRPGELLLASLAGCITQIIAWNSALHDISLEDVSITIRGRHELLSMFDPSVGWPGFNDIVIEVNVKTPEWDKFEKYVLPYIVAESPVLQTLVKQVPVKLRVSVNDKQRRDLYIPD
ncbi:OsmC family protein [Vulcanisaeta souniana]|uniref:OsmC family protein n=1 Tax=Vulcanisaeta souniana JCM 11219 TaxID=1293586 RepID=A0A830E500_9CREN|nr:OsmC family protein [Vulcanisaeta souniana]BDR93029.1 hypothetical protein Vsou_21220 [Vulcanisaeta souniana JCM 11219]GGI83484.1 hypothetical protein GCM10007112_20320 [Vulcanisaeta souniana JCM 11219]